ncbi:hypothetical protein V2I01_33950 [Micromonospora sp. BRA006-A]|nr:hypothetical protein [Micromonospora sp. BRA006-A]
MTRRPPRRTWPTRRRTRKRIRSARPGDERPRQPVLGTAGRHRHGAAVRAGGRAVRRGRRRDLAEGADPAGRGAGAGRAARWVTSARTLVAACAGHADGSAAGWPRCSAGSGPRHRAGAAGTGDRPGPRHRRRVPAGVRPAPGAGLEWRTGRLHAAYQAAAEAVRIAEQVALPVLRALGALALVEALLGDEPEALAHVEPAGSCRARDSRSGRYAAGVAAVVGARWTP